MRVISGTFRGKKLDSLEDVDLRPMLDRVKESLFNILRETVDDAAILDLFSGSGALGIEALSRGARCCIFVERKKKLAQLIERNLEGCGAGAGRTRILRCSVNVLPDMQPPEGLAPADLVFVDPPYAMTADPGACAGLFELMERLCEKWISADAGIVLHHAPAPYALWPTNVFTCVDRRVYGRSQLSFFELSG